MIAYEDAPRAAKAADEVFPRKGPKWELISAIGKQQAERIRQYKTIWLPDDDIYMHPAQMEAMFRSFEDLGWKFAQPALTATSYFAHSITRQRVGLKWRQTNFAEVMAPLFTAESFMQALPYFEKTKSGWGLDLLFSQKLFPGEVGILDETPMTHTRPLGARGKNEKTSSFYAEMETHPLDELEEVLREDSSLTMRFREQRVKPRLGPTLAGGPGRLLSRLLKPRKGRAYPGS